MSILKMQYPINKVLIVYFIVIGILWAIAFFWTPWAVLTILALDRLILILVDAYRAQRFLDAFSARMARIGEMIKNMPDDVDTDVKG